MIKGMALFRRFCDNVWEYDASVNEVYVYHNKRMPELSGQRIAYEALYEMYLESYICSEDSGIWEYYMSAQSLQNFLKRKKEEEHFFVRSKHGEHDIEWHEAYIEKISDTKLLIGSMDINRARRDATISQAVLPEFDYVCRIDVVTGGYVLYYSNDVKGKVPPSESNDYQKTMMAFTKQVIIPEEREALCRNMQIENVIKQLAEKDEYLLFATAKENGVLTYKKFRFCYADGQRREILLTRRDISALMKERKRRELEEKKRMEYLDNMPVGFCATEVLLDEEGQPKDFRYIYCNRAHEELEGVEPGELIGKRFYEFFDNTDPKWLRYYYETAYLGKRHIIREYSPEIGKDLLIHTFQMEKGHCECVVMDVTKEMFLSRELQRSREEMKRILETTTALVFQYYPKQGRISINKLGEAQEKDALPEEEVMHKLVIKGNLEAACTTPLLESLHNIREGEKHASITIRARRTIDSPWLWYRVVLFDYQDEFTQERKVLGYLQNIDRDILEQEKLRRKAQTDALTGLLNVGAGRKNIKDILERQSEAGMEYNAMFVMDIDDFKTVNDTLGHIVGDKVLKCFAKVLRETFRMEDVIYRLGGDEFAAFVENVQEYPLAIESIMERFSSQLAKAREKYPFMSVSVGIFVSNTTKDYQRYYQEADKALYETKRNGKSHYTLRIAKKEEH